MPTLLLEHLRVRDLRNLERVDRDPAPRVNVVTGNNGHGKTRLTEAIYFAATSRSFRTHRPADIIRNGELVASVVARFSELNGDVPPVAREQSAAIERSSCVLRVDGNRPSSLSSYATRSPV